MSKFNKKQTPQQKLKNETSATKNKAGGLAFQATPKVELTQRAVTALMKVDKYYESKNEVDTELDNAISQVLRKDPEYVLKLAVYCRNVLYLRSLPIWLIARYARSGVNIQNTRHYIYDVVQRPDEITELISATFAAGTGKGKLPNFIKNGLRPCFNKFDRYQFAKYNRSGEVTMKDAIFLCHPKPKNKEQQDIFDCIVAGTLGSAETWEAETSQKGSTKDVWEGILPRMGHLAVVRNLNNLLKVQASPEAIIGKVTNEAAILNSKTFPFQYLSAFRAIQSLPMKDNLYVDNEFYNFYLASAPAYMDALQTAMDISVANIPKFAGNTLILIDNSGSMKSTEINQNPNTKKRRYSDDRPDIMASDIANVFGAMAAKITDRHTVIVFGERFKNVFLSSRAGILENAEIIKNTDVGHATYAHLPIIQAIEKQIKYDRVLLFTDGQCYEDVYNTNTKYRSIADAFLTYQKKVNPNAYMHCVDLSGYGTLLFPQSTRNVCMYGGWSEKIFDFIHLHESNAQTLVDLVENYKLE